MALVFTPEQIGELNKTERLIYELIKCCELQGSPTNPPATESTLSIVSANTLPILAGLYDTIGPTPKPRLAQIQEVLKNEQSPEAGIYGKLDELINKYRPLPNSVVISQFIENAQATFSPNGCCKLEVRSTSVTDSSRFTLNGIEIQLAPSSSVTLFELSNNTNPYIELEVTLNNILVIQHIFT
jgi:hypothetical protein